MTFQSPKASRLMLTLCAAALLGAIPAKLTLDAQTGLIALKSAMAFAESGKGSGGSDDDSSGSGSGGDSDDDSDDDNSGSDDGSDDDSDDDNDSSGHGSDDGAGHDVGDDHGGDRPDTGGVTGGNGSGVVTVVKFESNAQAMEVVYSDGTKEEIELGRYERKNAAGRTVEERAATQADVDRLWSLR